MVRPLEIGKAALRLEDTTPYSEAFEDIYYSSENGLAESRHVFLNGNALQRRWADRRHFVIGETGFGTGLNFLATWQCWRQTAPDDAVLHFVSAERYPLDRETIRHALTRFPELLPLVEQLLAHYPYRLPGFHRIKLEGGRVRLTLLFGDAVEAYGRFHGTVDAWFLDGFAPSRNERMWTPTLFEQVAAHSAPGATLATFTAAGHVRRALEAAGFSVRKLPGFGGKREMIAARIATPSSEISSTPWFDPPPSTVGTESHCVVIGAGIAGCTMAHALTRRGISVRLIEREATIAQGASGNPAGLLMPKLTADQSLSSRFYTEAYRYTLALLRELEDQGQRPDWSASGVLQLGFHEKVRRSHAQVAQRELPAEFARVVDRSEASDLAGIESPLGGLWFPHGGWIDPRSFCRALLAASDPALIQTLTSTEALSWKRGAHGWSITDRQDREIAQGTHVILCAGPDTQELLPEIGRSLVPVRGQITRVPVTARSRHLKSVLCYKGYLTPPLQGQHVLGATYDRHDLAVEPRADDNADNLEKLHRVLPGWFDEIGHDSMQARAALRSTTPDRLPIVGAVPELTGFEDAYGDLWRGRKPHRYPAARCTPGVFISAGHSSRGLIGAPLAAEIIADQIEGVPSAVERELLDAIHPARFLIRALKKRPESR